jgi:hypothetical protein
MLRMQRRGENQGKLGVLCAFAVKILPPDIINTQVGDYRLTRIGLKEPMLGKKLTSTVCFTAVRPQNGNCCILSQVRPEVKTQF